MYDGEDTLAIYPATINRQYACIMQYSCLVKPHASTMDSPGEGYLIGMEEVKA